MPTDQAFVGYTGQSFPDLYASAPPAPREKKPGQLAPELIKQYFENGYLVVKDFFKEEELNACREAVSDLVEDLAQRLYKAGKIQNLHKDCGLFQRLTKLEEDFPGASIIMHKTGVLPKMTFVKETAKSLIHFIIKNHELVQQLFNQVPKKKY